MAETNSHPGSAHKLPNSTKADGCSSTGPDAGISKSLLARILRSDLRLQFAILVFMLMWYGVLLAISWRLALNDPVRLTFNSMLDHLLRGRFDVDPQIVRYEGYVRNGHVYAYFGIWCALLRLPLWVANRMNVDMTFWSCLAAVCLAGMAKVRAVLLIRRNAIESPMGSRAIKLFLAYMLFAGSAVAFLQVSIYQEVILWAYAFAAVFVYFALKGVINRSFSTGMLCSMAACAGLAVLTRASTGFGLAVAFLLLLAVLALNAARAETKLYQQNSSRLGRVLVEPHMTIPLGILAILMGGAGAVNYFRWGNPFTFDNPDLYVMRNAWPHFLSSLHTYGFFNLRRIPYGVIYYFVPVWVLRGGHGHLLFSMPQSPLLGVIDLPPSSFFLTDLPVLGFILLFVIALRNRGRDLISLSQSTAIALGLMAPCALMLSFPWMLYRYRMEFYPELEFLALLGLYLTVTDEEMLRRFSRLQNGFRAGLVVSIVASVGALALWDVGGDASPDEIVQPGIVHYYLDKVMYHLHRI